MQEENKIWEGCPSQWTNFMFYLFCVPFTLLYGFGFLLALWKFLDTLHNKIIITDQRIIEKKGILNKITTELELYRVKDIQLREPFFLRIFSLSNIVLTSSDEDNPIQLIKGIDTGNEIKEKLRVAVDIRRDLKRVMGIDFN